MPRSGIRMGGPIPKFNDYHLWKALNILNSESNIGRKRLSTLLMIGEGSTRTVLNILQDARLIVINKNGVSLTPEGIKCWNDARMAVCEVDAGTLTIGHVDCAVQVKKSAIKVKYGCEERDTAIRAGAIGATTLICESDGIYFPGSEYRVEHNVEKELKEKFALEENDVVIIGTANTYQEAEMGAVMSGLSLIGGLHMNRNLDNIMTDKSSGNELISLAFAIHDLVGGLPVCAKSKNNLGIRIENGAVVDNAYTGPVLEEVLNLGTTIRKIAPSGVYKGIKVIVTPIELDSKVIAVIGVVDIRSMAGVNNLIRLSKDQ